MTAPRVLTFYVFILLGGRGLLGRGGNIPSVSDICHSPIGVVLPSHVRVVRSNISWSSPCLNDIKINVDDSFSSTSSANGIGSIFRDH